jgi:hypothetical protein
MTRSSEGLLVIIVTRTSEESAPGRVGAQQYNIPISGPHFSETSRDDLSVSVMSSLHRSLEVSLPFSPASRTGQSNSFCGKVYDLIRLDRILTLESWLVRFAVGGF